MTVCTPLRLSVKTTNAPDFAAEAESGALHLFAAKADGDLNVGIPSGLILPLGLGISFLLTGFGLYHANLLRITLTSLSSVHFSMSSIVNLSTPGVVLPLSRLMFRYASRICGACNTIRFFITLIFTQPHPRRHERPCTISTHACFRPIHSQVRQCFCAHSRRSQFVDPRPIRYAIHLWTDFDDISTITVPFSRLH